MKLLSGSELAGYIKERQARQVRSLVQAHKIQPKLAIIQIKDDPVINLYVRLKQAYGADINSIVDVHKINQNDARNVIEALNKDKSVHGIIVQLPISDISEQDVILNCVDQKKDVDGLTDESLFDPATPQAILWLLAGYNIDLRGKEVVIIGRGRLVGLPLFNILQDSQLSVRNIGKETTNLKDELQHADIVISATGQPGLITPDMIKASAVVIDAGLADEGGAIKGDLHPALYDRNDLKITPVKGGVGPLTVTALFENVIKAAQARTRTN